MDERRVLILAPRGRDAAVIEQVLTRSGTSCAAVADPADLTGALNAAAGAVIVTEEAIPDDDIFPWLEQQPPWSDFPFVVLATKQVGPRSARAAALVERLGNVVLLERPVNAETLTRAVAAALRARDRQYQARSHLAEREQAQERLRLANETLERRVEERTREVEAARETLSVALDSAGMGSWDLDLVRDVSRRSARHDHIFGYDQPLRQWGRGDLLSHVVPEDRPPVAAAFDAAAASGEFDVECRIRRRDDVVRWIAMKGRVEYDGTGTAIRMAGVVLDHTDQRTTEDALRQAQKMEAIGQLTGGVAHDFNNLLTVIVGALDMMIRRPEQAERVKRLAASAMTAARRGEQLTQQLLAFSRRQMLRPRTLNPNRVLLDFKPLADRAAGGAIELSFDLDPGIDPIRVDPPQFEAAVLNLIVNARDAMETRSGAGSSTIRVRTRNTRLEPAAVAEKNVSPGDFVEVAVSDTGGGIAPDTLARVFEPFFTTKDVGKGTGLGLSQVYGFTRSADGFATIDSVVGAGTTVRLLFPRSTDPAIEDGSTAGTGTLPLRRAFADETVLLVEDDAQVLDMAIESLEELQYKVIVARNAFQALDHLKSGERIDIMFSDVVMPGGMNGSQLATEAWQLRPELKILLTSGYVADLGEGQVLADSRLPVLSKPYRRDELARSLRLVLEGEGLG